MTIASVPASRPATRMNTRLSSSWLASICEGMSTLTMPMHRLARVARLASSARGRGLRRRRVVHADARRPFGRMRDVTPRAALLAVARGSAKRQRIGSRPSRVRSRRK